MKLAVATLSAASVVSFPQKNLDAGNVKEFRAAMQPVIAGSRNVLLDMGTLEFVDSSGLGALISCLRALRSNGGELRLFGMTKPVMALFELVRMHRLFSIHPSRDDALADLAPAARATGV